MSLHRPPSNDKPDGQSSETPSGKKIPMAMSMMIDSLVRMVQKANSNESDSGNEDSNLIIDED